MSKPEDPDYTVGKGRPPVHSRFQKGQSGNPRGRPKGSKGLKAALWATLQKKVTVTEGGRRRRITMLEYIINKLSADAALGKPHAAKLLIQLLDDVPDPMERSSDISSARSTKVTSDMSAREAADAYEQSLRESDAE